MNNLIKKIKKNTGITLLEVIITMAILSLVLGLIGSFARDLFFYEDVFTGGLTSYDEARKILQPITSEIRSASPSSLGSYPLEKTGQTEFIFFADIDNNGIKERVRYFLSDNIMKRGVIIPSGNPLQYLSANETISDIIHGIRNDSVPVFDYYDSNYNGSTAPLNHPVSVLDVRLVKISLILDEDPNKPPAPMTVTTQVSIRNLKDNL